MIAHNKNFESEKMKTIRDLHLSGVIGHRLIDIYESNAGYININIFTKDGLIKKASIAIKNENQETYIKVHTIEFISERDLSTITNIIKQHFGAI